MTIRQKLLKLVYPLFTLYQRAKGSAKVYRNNDNIEPPISFYTLFAKTNSGDLLFEKLRGKKVLLVNTASDCGYTAQYEELQKLYQHAKEDLEIIAFPSNDFKGQEKKDDDSIAKFCGANYGIRFPVAKKSEVIKSGNQHPVYKWLTDKKLNGWNEKAPKWNFSKYLVNEAGLLTHYFDPAVSPLSEDMFRAINE